MEIELKIALGPGDEARLRRHPALARYRTAPRRKASLLSIYFDTPDHALSAKGIALRLRKVGRSWVQTVKAGRTAGGAGLFAQQEFECPAPGGRLALGGTDPDGIFAAIATAANGAALSPVFETRIQRVIEDLRTEDGSVIELALDTGKVVAGDASAPLSELELELKSGSVGALYDFAAVLFPRGPVRFATANKAALGYRLARGEVPQPLGPRKAGSYDHDADATLETVARDTFRDCFAQIATNLVVVAETDAIEGPHQLRVGLRRLRTAIAVFGNSLGSVATTELSATARDLGRTVGRLRDIDVLIDEVVSEAADLGLDAEARAALIKALEARREIVRAEVRAALADPATVRFVFELGRFTEGRGWLDPGDISQTERLATPIGKVAPNLLEKRHAKVAKRGRKIRKLDVESLHELRKDLKKLRYAADILSPIYSGKKVAAYVQSLKHLQDRFGTLNDAAMVEEYLTGAEAPGRSSPEAQRAIGWVLGTLAIRVADDRPALFDRWDAFAATKPFWR